MKKFLLILFTCAALIFASGCSNDNPIPVKSVTLYKYSMSLALGKSERLLAIIKPADAKYEAITWATSDPAIATVDAGGTITSVAVGTTTITVTAANQSAVCTVSVIIPATSIKLESSTLKLIVGDTHQFTTEILPGNTTQNTVTWESSNPLVATIGENGQAEALAAGTTTISASLTDKIKAQCVITVKAGPGEGWNVGDFYELNGIKGVVVTTINDGANGKLVSLNEHATPKWATTADPIGCTSETDGQDNTLKAKRFDGTLTLLPTFKWCIEQGSDWYMPAIQEVFMLLRNLTLINPTIKANGGKELSDNYWSSTESAADGASALAASYNAGNPTSHSSHKTDSGESKNVRAMYGF